MSEPIFRWQFIADLTALLERQFRDDQDTGLLSTDDVDDIESALVLVCRRYYAKAERQQV